MSKRTKNILIAVLLAAAVACTAAGAGAIHAKQSAERLNPNVTVIPAPEQSGFETHPEWQMPEAEQIDYGENIALGKTAEDDGHTQIYLAKNAVDDNPYTYWEGKADAFPNTLTVDLGAASAVTGAQIVLNPNAIWSARTQEVEVQISGDGEQFETVVPRTELSFDPFDGANSAYIDFGAALEGQYVRFLFFSNSGATGGQAAEIQIFAPAS